MKDWEDIVEMEFGNKLHEIAHSLFGRTFSMVYEELPSLSYFPRGVVKLEDIPK